MNFHDAILFHALELRSSLRILASAAQAGLAHDHDEQSFIAAETPLAIADAEAAITALEAVAARLAGVETPDQAQQPPFARAKSG